MRANRLRVDIPNLEEINMCGAFKGNEEVIAESPFGRRFSSVDADYLRDYIEEHRSGY